MIRRLFFLAAVSILISSCVAPDTRHRIVVSIPEQKLALLDNGALIATYPISTSRFAIGDAPGSRGTPLGELEVAKKIGDSAPSGMVFKDRRATGEVLAPDAPGRDPIVTRILWLRGREAQNANAYSRYIYIHGTPEERNIGTRASFGCIRMRSRDVIQLYDIVGPQARVTILNAPLAAMLPEPKKGD
jgi:lipoprotein-anchoring transpeptidase ErfK/SrfK